LYRAVDAQGQTIDFLLTEQRDQEAALRFLKKAIRRDGVPETITIDESEANATAIRGYDEAHGTAIIIRQIKYLNNGVEQDPLICALRPLLNVSTGSDQSIGPRLPMDILVARNSPRKPQTVS
jgi:transposase-like protein